MYLLWIYDKFGGCGEFKLKWNRTKTEMASPKFSHVGEKVKALLGSTYHSLLLHNLP